MTLHKVILRDPQGPTREIFGYISRVNHADESFLFLDRNQVGVIGQDGTLIAFSDCEGVYYQTQPGRYNSDEQITVWRRYARTQLR